MSGYTDFTNLENSRNCLRRIARHDDQQFSKDSLVNIMEKFVKTVNAMDETILVPCRLMDRQVGDTTELIQTKIIVHHNHQYHHNKKVRATSVNEFLNSADLFNLYNMLNSLKNDLLWTRSDSDEGQGGEDEEVSNKISSIGSSNGGVIPTSSTSTSLVEQDGYSEETTSTINSANSLSAPIKTHVRRPSTGSMTSSNSVSNLSDSESEISNENDSGVELEGNCIGKKNRNSTSSDKATELARQCRTHLAGLYRCLEQMTEAANYLTARYQSDVGPV